MTATIHCRPNYEHEAKVLAERRRRDQVDPLWRYGVLANAYGTALVGLRPEPASPSRPFGDHHFRGEGMS